MKLEGSNWFTQAQALLARAIAAGHLHDAQSGKAAAEALEASVAMYPKLEAGSSYATLPDEIRAWVRFAQGDIPGAVTLLQPVADRQDKLGEGGIEVPAREMLADIHFLNGQFAEALHEYQGCSPAIRTASTHFLLLAKLPRSYVSVILRPTTTAHCWQIAPAPTAVHR